MGGGREETEKIEEYQELKREIKYKSVLVMEEIK